MPLHYIFSNETRRNTRRSSCRRRIQYSCTTLVASGLTSCALGLVSDCPVHLIDRSRDLGLLGYIKRCVWHLGEVIFFGLSVVDECGIGERRGSRERKKKRMVAVRRIGWFLAREIKNGDGLFVGGGGSTSLHASAAAPAAAAAAERQESGGPSSAMAARITPAVLFITVLLAVVLLVSGLLHILRRLFLKSHHANARAEAVERQLQQLFHLHEDGAGPGLDQAAIDALPAFAYGELATGASAAKGARQFDCAVCLCEFAADDRLRLLPLCGHAFHVACIDTWLRSSSTCPLCRTALSARTLAAAVVVDGSVEPADIEEQKQEQDQASSKEAAAASSVVLPVRLGRFKNVLGSAAADGGEASTSSRLDARRCYSMGSYQYVLADDNLVVSVHWRPGDGSTALRASVTTTASDVDHQQGKKVCAASRGDSFSVSKIWQWRGAGDRRLPGLHAAGSSSPADDGLPWAPASARSTRQEIDA